MALSLSADLGRDRLVDVELAGEGLVLGEGIVHLVAGDVRGFAGLLDVHAELDDVEEELEEVLVLRVAALDGEGEERPAVLQGQPGRQGRPRPLARGDDVEGILPFFEDEALGPLAHAHAGLPGDDARDPAAARGHGDDPALLVGGLDRCRPGAEGRLDFRGFLRIEGGRLSPAPLEPAVEIAEIRIGLALRRGRGRRA